MTSLRLERVDLRHLTTNQPFYAGLVPMVQDKLLVMLSSDTTPRSYRMSSISSGQIPGETIWNCAIRAGRNELGATLPLQSSHSTYFHDIDSGELYEVTCSDSIAPLVLERQSNLYPYTPRRRGLPSGPYTYYALFLTHLEPSFLPVGNHSGGGLLLLPPSHWSLLEQQPTLEALISAGVEVIEREPLIRTHRLRLHIEEPLAIAISLLQKRPELRCPLY